MISEYVKSLAIEYLALINLMSSGEYDGMQLTSLSAQRTLIHDELVRLLGSDYERPFDIRRYCQELVNRSD